MSDELQLPRAARVFVSFVSLLRVNGFAVAPEQTTTFLSAVELLGPRSLEDIHRAGLATLAPPPERRATYDHLFDIHFRGSEALDYAGPDDEDVVRLQEEGRGDDEALLADEVNEFGARCGARRSARRAPLRIAHDGGCLAPLFPRGALALAATERSPADARAPRPVRGSAPDVARQRAQ